MILQPGRSIENKAVANEVYENLCNERNEELDEKDLQENRIYLSSMAD